MPENRLNKKPMVKVGTVVKDKMKKTVIVRIDGVSHHALYGRVLRRKVKVKVHDEKNLSKSGDIVKIIQVRPLSKDKRWNLLEVITKK